MINKIPTGDTTVFLGYPGDAPTALRRLSTHWRIKMAKQKKILVKHTKFHEYID